MLTYSIGLCRGWFATEEHDAVRVLTQPWCPPAGQWPGWPDCVVARFPFLVAGTGDVGGDCAHGDVEQPGSSGRECCSGCGFGRDAGQRVGNGVGDEAGSVGVVGDEPTRGGRVGVERDPVATGAGSPIAGDRVPRRWTLTTGPEEGLGDEPHVCQRSGVRPR